MKTQERDGTTFYLSDDGKEYRSRSGAWKRNKLLAKSNSDATAEAIDSPPADEAVSSESLAQAPAPAVAEDDSPSLAPPATPTPDEGAGDSSPKWMDFQMGDATETTDTIPTPLRMLTPADPKRKLSAKERKAAKDTELAMLTMGLTGVDHLLTAYGKAITLNDSFKVVHSSKSKKIVAEAQYAYLDEKGIMISSYLSRGAIAGALTGWYCLAPLSRIRKNAKKPMIKRIGGSFLSRIPFIGRFFKPKQTEQLFNKVEVVE